MLIKINDTGMPYGIREIVQQLPDPHSVNSAETITLKFIPGEFVYLTGLVLLAAWRKALPAGVHLMVDDQSCLAPTQRLLTNTGFREVSKQAMKPHQYRDASDDYHKIYEDSTEDYVGPMRLISFVPKTRRSKV